MADDKHYVPGDYYQIDDIRGYKVRASRTQTQWDGRVTLPESFSERQPQDFVTGVKDDQSVGVPRPRQQNQFTMVGTFVTQPSPAGSNSMAVESTNGFAVGNMVQVVLDNGENFSFTLATITGNVLGWNGAPLPFSVGTIHGDPIENAVVNLQSFTLSAQQVINATRAQGGL